MNHILNNVKPLFVLVVSYLLQRLNIFFFQGSTRENVAQLIVIGMFFSLGLMLHRNKRKNQDWLKKVVISFIVLLVIFVRFSIVQITWMSIGSFILLNPLIINAFIVHLGWLFFE